MIGSNDGLIFDSMLPRLDEGDNLQEAFEYAKEKVKERRGHEPSSAVFWYDSKDKECEWWSHFSPIKYFKKK